MDLINNPEIELSYIKTYGWIDHEAGKRGYWYDTQKKLAEKIGLSHAQLKRALRWLHANDFIDSKTMGPKYNNCRKYYILARTTPLDDEDEDSSPMSQGWLTHEPGGSSPMSQGVAHVRASHSYPQIYNHRSTTTDLSLAPDPKNDSQNAGKAEDKAAKRPQESNLKNQEASAMQPSEQLSPEQRAIWDELALKFGQPRTPRELTARRFCVGQLHQANATPSQIRQAYRKWGEKYPKAGCTPHALVDHWGELLHNVTDLAQYPRYQAPPVDAEREKEAIRTQTKADYSAEDQAAFERFMARKAAKRAAKGHEGAFEA